MSIRDRQILNATTEALTKELKDGRYPDRDTVVKKASEKFTTRPAGLPRFVNVPAEKYGVSDQESYNTMLRSIYEDLNTGFDEVRALSAKILGTANLYDTQKIMIEKQIQLLERRVQNLAYRSQIKQESIFNTFADFKYVDFLGNPDRNIPKTSAFVDLRFGMVTLGNLKTLSTKYDITKALIEEKIISPYKDTTVLSPLDNALKDTINESWRQIVTTTAPGTMKMQISVMLDNPVPVTSLAFIVNSPKATQIAVSLSADGVIWKHLDTKDIVSNAEWSFPDTLVKYMRIMLTKNEPDNSNTTAYEYYFGLQNISLVYGQFKDQAVFVSEAHPLENVVNQVSLEVDEVTPAATNIRYYVGLDRPQKTVDWTEIRNGQTIEFGTYKQESQNIDLYTQNVYGRSHAEQAGVNYHYIYEFPTGAKPKPETIRLMLGPRMWIKDSIQESLFIKTDKDNPTMRDWLNTGTATSAFIHSGDNLLPLDTGMFNRYTIYVYSPAEITIKAPVEVNGLCKFSVYLNNNLLQKIVGSYTYHFTVGWNKIQICSYAEGAGSSIKLNLDFGGISDEVYAYNKPLTLTTIYDLMNNTSKKDFTKFALVDNYIVVNYDPVALDESKSVGVTYQLSYDHIPIDTSQNQVTGIRLMAVLTREAGAKNMAPQLREYRLLLS